MNKQTMTRVFRATALALAIAGLSACSTTQLVSSEAVKSVESIFKTPAQEEPVKVYFAGVSFTGNYAHQQSNYPNVLKLAENGALDRAFNEELKKHEFKNVILTTDLGKSIKAYDAVAMTLGINLETLTSQYLPRSGSYKTVADVYAEILIFDFDTKKIITSLPINMQYITITKNKLTKAQERQIFEGMILGTNKEVPESLLQIAAKKIQSAKIKRDYGIRFKVQSVPLSKEEVSELEKFNANPAQFELITAQMMTRSLVDNLNVAVLPATYGEAIGEKMTARFADGMEFELKVPDPDYLFKIDLQKFWTRANRSKALVDVEAYFVFLKIMFEQPDLAKQILDRNFRASSIATIVKGQNSDKRVVYMETLFNFFEAFTKNIKDTETDWLKTVTHPKNVSSTEDQLEEIYDIMKKGM